MKKIIIAILAISSLVFASNANGNHKDKMFQSVPFKKATILQKGKAKYYCVECGMTLPMFYKTNHAAEVDGKVQQFCSMHCLVEATLKHKNVKNIKVVDTKSLKFIDAKKATYVVGSSIKGTMTKTSKYAFASKKDAISFAKRFGGKVMSFDEAFALAKKAFKKEQAMISKKQAKMAKKGKMMYNKFCKKTDKKFNSTAEAKAYIKQSGICGNIKGKKLQAIGIYLGRR
jgi:nitrous oxide reductase accessory protein NosL